MGVRGLGLGGLGAVGVLAWGMIMAFMGVAAEGVLVLLLLSLLLGVWKIVFKVVFPLWLITWLFLNLFYSPLESLSVSLRFAVIAVAGAVGFGSAGPLALSLFFIRIGLPAGAAASIAMVYRMAEYLAGFVPEARDALRGRGLGGRLGSLARVPIPLVVHSFRASFQVAEALYFKPPRRDALLRLGSGLEWFDVVLLFLLAGAALLAYVERPLGNLIAAP